TLTHPCPSAHERLFDCNHDDYFNTAPAAGSYLAGHWNAASNSFLEKVEPTGAPTTTSAPPTTLPPTTTTLPPTTTTTVPPVATRQEAPANFDGDARTDVSVFRPSTGGWFVRRSSG